MTVLDQVLEAETRSEAAIKAAKETAARTIAEAEASKQTAIAEAKTAALKTVEEAKSSAQANADTEALDIITAADKDAATVKQTITSNRDVLTTTVVDAFNNAKVG